MLLKQRSVYEPCPIVPTNQISIDWHTGHIIYDTPGAALFCGFFAQYPSKKGVRFNNGISLKKVTIKNDKGIPYPVADDEKYVTFGVVSTDGKPLSETKHALMSIQSTSFNSGFKVDASKIKHDWFWSKGAHPNGTGELPVLFARAKAEIKATPLKGMSYTMYDWHYEVLKTGKIDSDSFTIPNDIPVFMIELKRG